MANLAKLSLPQHVPTIIPFYLWHPPSQKGKEVKVYYAFQESTRPPTVVVFTNDPELWRKDYLRFFQRRLREHLNIRYAPLRLILKGREEEKL